MKESTLNIKLSTQLYDKVKEEADKYGVSIAAFVRASLARQIIGDKKENLIGGKDALIDGDGAYIFALGKKKDN